jgi:hypothetical protein
MLQLRNDTPFETDRAILLDKGGNHVWIVVVKATYTLHPDGHLELAKKQEPVCKSPEYRGAPESSSLRRECEVVVEHPGTDIIVNGHAYAPAGRAVRELDVGIRVGSLRKSLKVFGDRYWERGLSGVRSTSPTLFKTLPLVYERAYGGYAPGNEEPRPFESRNPVGRGFTPVQPEDGHALPNVEYPQQCISSWKERPPPAGFGAIASWWSPRQQYAGTYDQAWQERRMPLWPEDLDPRHFLSVPEDQVSLTRLSLTEQVELRNLTPSSLLTFRLPPVYVVVDTDIGGERYRKQVRLERVIIEPDDHKLVLVWRSWLDCGRNARCVRKSIVWTKKVVQ